MAMEIGTTSGGCLAWCSDQKGLIAHWIAEGKWKWQLGPREAEGSSGVNREREGVHMRALADPRIKLRAASLLRLLALDGQDKRIHGRHQSLGPFSIKWRHNMGNF